MRNRNEGYVSYLFAKPGKTATQPKIAYVTRFVPWNLVFTVGTYTGDLTAAFRASLEDLAAIGGVILIVTLLTAWLSNRDITGSLGRLKSADRRDEVGQMAGVVLVFKQRMERGEQLAAEREQEREQAEAAKLAALVAMAETIEAEAKQALSNVGLHTADMAKAANDMSASAARTGA